MLTENNKHAAVCDETQRQGDKLEIDLKVFEFLKFDVVYFDLIHIENE